MFSCLNYEEAVLPMTPVIEFDAAKSDPCKFYRIVDEWSQQDFAKNYGGHPRSDIAILDAQNDLNAASNLLARLFERKPDGVSDQVNEADIRFGFRSKYCQTASERIEYYERLLEERDNRALEQMEKKDREKAEAELKAKRDKLRSTLTNEEKEYLRQEARKRAISELND